jgi:hypothetical protein
VIPAHDFFFWWLQMVRWRLRVENCRRDKADKLRIFLDWSAAAALKTSFALSCRARGPRFENVFVFGPVWRSSASPVELFLRKQLHKQLHKWERESCFCSFTICLTQFSEKLIRELGRELIVWLLKLWSCSWSCTKLVVHHRGQIHY